MAAIVVDKLSKEYHLGRLHHETSFREAVIGALRRPFRPRERLGEALWALKDVSFEIARGEVVGIIGRNGAGKSTLLKLLSRITYPTSGHVRIDGRVGSLLEVGTGFHHELTGRENIYLNGSILGMRKGEINRKLDAIIAFSGVEKFIDTPIKRYSSGMRLRLGFAVAAHLDPDTLLVDEVLAVGDAEFQKKCLTAMDDLHSGGRTVLFVSHNMAAVEHLCPRAIWMENGQVRQDGPSHDVIRNYLAAFVTPQHDGFDFSKAPARRGNGDVQITRMQFLDADLKPKGLIRSGDSLTVRLNFQAKTRVATPYFGVAMYTDLGTLVASANTWISGPEIPVMEAGSGHIDLHIDFLNLLPRSYYLSLWARTANGVNYDTLDHCAVMEVDPSDYYQTGRGIDGRFGVVFLPCRWSFNGESPQERTMPVAVNGLASK